MKKIKKLLSTALFVSLAMSLGVGYNKNCSAMEYEHMKLGYAIYNDRDIPMQLKVSPNSPKQEILSALIELKNYISLKAPSVNLDNRIATGAIINQNFLNYYHVNNMNELATRVEYDFLDVYYRYSFKYMLRGRIGRGPNIAGYLYTILRNAGFESYVLTVSKKFLCLSIIDSICFLVFSK